MALTGSEILQVQGIDGAGRPAATTTQTTTAAIAALASLESTSNVATTISTVGAGTLTAASIVGGLILRTGTQVGAITDTTATAAQIIAALPTGAPVGSSFFVIYTNNTAGGYPATIAGGTGVTITGAAVIPAGMTVDYLVTYATATTVTMQASEVGLSAGTSLALAGATSGQVQLIPTAVAGANSVLTLPAATDTLVARATTDTLTNKTLTGNTAVNLISGSGTLVLNTTGTATVPNATDTLVGKATTDVLTNKTLTGNTAVNLISGSGTLTLNTTGTATVPNATDTLVGKATTDTLTNKTLSGAIYTNTVRASASVTANATTTYANVTGLSQTVVTGGTYKFKCVLPSTVASGTGGIKYAFNYTTTVLTSIEATGIGFTASAVAVQHTTTTTTQTDLFTQAAVVIMTILEGTFIVTTGGTIDVQVAQNTSNASNTIALLGGSFECTRIA